MLSIGWRNLKRDRIRMAVAVFGVIFAVVLVTLEVGMMLGMTQNASLLIDRSRADVWVSTLNVRSFDAASPIDQRKQYLIESVPGVARVEEFNVSYSLWKLPGGGNANVQVIGFDPGGELAPPLELAQGRLADLRNRDAVIIDVGECAKLGGTRLGDQVEIMEYRATVVGLTDGMRAFTTTPYVFTSLHRAEKYGWLTTQPGGRSDDPMSIYFLVKAQPGVDPAELARRIAETVPDVEAHTREAFASRTRMYWLFEMGVGIGFLAAALLGVLVGGVIVSQTLYAMTVEKLPEFGVLKALGAGMDLIARVVLEQSLFCGAAGLTAGLLLSYALGAVATAAGTAMMIPWPLAVGVAGMTVALSGTASLVSIVRLRRVEPASVFRA